MRFSIILFLILLTALSCTTNKEVDLIVYNATIYTVDSTFSTKEAIAIKDGIFVDMGTSTHILKKYNAKESIDAEGQFVYPGLYDAHGHFFMLADLLDEVDLNGSKSISEVIERLKEYKATYPDKKWIVGGGWDQNLWDLKEFPTKDSLDAYFPNTPIFLSRTDYHAAWINSAALSLLKLDTIPEIEGGRIVVDDLNSPTGILVDNAMNLIKQHLPIPDDNETLSRLRRAQDSLFSVGLTSIVDAGLNKQQIDFLIKYYERDSLKIRNYAMIHAYPGNIKKVVKFKPYESDRLSIRSVKLMADGALGSRGACLLDHYSDSPTHGFLLYAPEEYDNMIKLLANTKLQVNTHAIGDSANRVILDAYGKYLKLDKDHRWRIEHAQIVKPSDIDKFKIFQVIPSVQPTHATSDMYWAGDRLGSTRIKYAYAYKDLLDQYGLLALGSDFPVEDYHPLYGFHAAIARVDQEGYPEGGFQIENAISREDALKGMTIWAAYSCFQETKRGSIEQGKDADFIILEKDIMTIPADEIRDTKTLRTVIGGKTVFKR